MTDEQVTAWLAKASAATGQLSHVHNGTIGFDGSRLHTYKRMGTGCKGGCDGFPIEYVGALMQEAQNQAEWKSSGLLTPEVQDQLAPLVGAKRLTDAVSGFEEPALYALVRQAPDAPSRLLRKTREASPLGEFFLGTPERDRGLLWLRAGYAMAVLEAITPRIQGDPVFFKPRTEGVQ